MRELELRGLLQEDEYNEAHKSLALVATPRPNNKISQFFVFDRGILKVSQLESDHTTVIAVKLGDEANNSLEEFETVLKYEAFEHAINVIKHLGYALKERVEQKRTDYELTDITISLKYTDSWGYHFEVEKMLDENDDEAIARSALQEICDRYQLKPLSPSELRDFLDKLSSRV